MKYFTEPHGKFVIKVPTEWQYKNIAAGFEEKPPFSFELYENPIGAFQISCYSEKEKPLNKKIKIQNVNTKNLEFVKEKMTDEQFTIQLWFASVGDHFFIAKYIYDSDKENDPEVKSELLKSEKSLSTLELVSDDLRSLATDIDKFEKFMASLAASFDLKNKALENRSLIELIIISANQIDAYLRLSIVLEKQLAVNTKELEIELLYQGESDPPIMERKIYKKAKNEKIIDEDLFGKLEKLYKKRNKIVHRYIISEFRTRDLFQIAFEYESLCEETRLILRTIEDKQFSKGIGIYGSKRNPHKELSKEDLKLLYSQVNDKHLTEDYYREITAPNKRS